MGFYDRWPYFVGTALIFAFASTPLLRLADLPPTFAPARVQTIDGLRGLLAFGVFFHHAAIYHQYLLTGSWALPPARFYANLGQVGVAMFFMITGHLFWTQMLKARGRPSWLRLYVGRVFRIVPLYLTLASIVLLTVGALTGWHLAESPLSLAKDVGRWLAGGVLVGGNVNAIQTFAVSAGVTWSLQYEWMFYTSLLVIAPFARRWISGLLLPVMGVLIVTPILLLHPGQMQLVCALMFLVGMATASVEFALAHRLPKTPQWILSTGVVGCLALVLLGFDGIYGALPILILGLALGMVVSGATVYGLLLIRPAKRLGDISYGIYLLQGPVLFLAFAPPVVRARVMGSAWSHWVVVMIAAMVLVMFATVAHGLIERPGIQAGQRVYAMLASLRRPKRHRIGTETKSQSTRDEFVSQSGELPVPE